MADQNHRAGIFGQRFHQSLAAFDVEVVGGFVKDQQMRRVDGGQQQGQPGFLAARQPTDGSFGLIGHQAKPSQPRAQPGLAFRGAQTHDVLQRCFVDVQLIHLMLGEVADAQLGRTHKFTLGGIQLACQQLGKRGFPFAVAAQQSDTIILINTQRQLFQDRRAAIAHGHAFHVDDRRR
ncbi:MAG: hypothetical protein ACD_54C01282G0007 [uncultured bacterium]|nr:MAG: hypothetical protein ACD_54C01282G0007 [uncultured bacterium]